MNDMTKRLIAILLGIVVVFGSYAMFFSPSSMTDSKPIEFVNEEVVLNKIQDIEMDKVENELIRFLQNLDWIGEGKCTKIKFISNGLRKRDEDKKDGYVFYVLLDSEFNTALRCTWVDNDHAIVITDAGNNTAQDYAVGGIKYSELFKGGISEKQYEYKSSSSSSYDKSIEDTLPDPSDGGDGLGGEDR